MFVKIIFSSIISLLLVTNTLAESNWGEGKLVLSNGVVKKFIEYVKGSHTKTPHLFAVSVDGKAFSYTYCSSGLNCEGGDEQILQYCSREAGDLECKLFARKRTIKWRNGVNPGKGKISKISSKWTEKEIFVKLTELGFYGDSKNFDDNQLSLSTNNSKEKIKIDSDEIRKLERYLKLGIIDESEFNEKKKLLSKN